MSLVSSVIAARPALAAFGAMGVCWGSFAADLPDLKAMLGVDEARLGLLLFVTPLAAITAMLAAPLAARALGRFCLPAAVLAMAAAFALPGQAAAVWAFPLAMLAAGATTGLTDVVMNARVAAIEAARGQSLMNLCHAAYSFGYAGGAVLTGVLRAASLGPGAVLAAMAGLAFAIGLASVERDGHITGLGRPRAGEARDLGTLPLIGGAIVLIAFLTENASENWSALHIEKTLGGSPAHGAMGPAVLAFTMGIARLFGQRFSQSVSPVRLLSSGAVLAAAGLLIAASATGPGWAYLGFVVAGIGASVIAPTAFSLVGRLAAPEARARAVARATFLGYFGYFVGPPAFGFLAGAFGLRVTLALAAGLLTLVLVLAPLMVRQGRISGQSATG